MDRLVISPAFCILTSFLLLVLHFRWLTAAAFAASMHELCHVVAVRLCGGRIFRVQLRIGGAELETDGLPLGKELLCTLAGPVGSLSLLLLRRIFPEAAVCGLLQGIYNLLPVYPLDGGRALHCLLRLLLPGKDWTLKLETGISIGTVAGLVLMLLKRRLFPMAAALSACTLLGGIARKIACKSSHPALQ